MSTNTVELIARYILNQLNEHRPLFIALQGPQGSGKSYVSAHLQSFLQSPPYSLRVAVLSIDDIYYPHQTLVSLAAANPLNALWRGRGQPGTHDITLGLRILSALKAGNCNVELPRFDKSLFSGEGDRLPLNGTGPIITQPPIIDIVILEGWCVGFHPIPDDELSRRWNGIWKIEREKLGLGEEQMGRKIDIEAINRALHDYLPLWSFFDVFVHLKPEPPHSPELSKYHIVYKWRLEQEHNMKAINGGRGMSDEAVKLFVDRYIPGYVFFGDFSRSEDETTTTQKTAGRTARGLTLVLDESRRVVESDIF